MRSSVSSWSRLQSGFARQVRSPRFQSQFDALRRAYPALGSFATPESVIAHQHSKLVSHTEHDLVGYSLVAGCKSGSPHREAASALLFLSLHPALSCAYGKVCGLYVSEADAAGDVVLAFFLEVERWPLENTAYVAAGLKLNTLRAVLKQRKKVLRDHDRVQTLLVFAEIVMAPDFEGPVPTDEIVGTAAWNGMGGPEAPYMHSDHEVTRLRRRLSADLGLSRDDAMLLVLRNLCGHTWNDLARRFRVKPESVRMRHHRLVRKLRCHPVVTSVGHGFGIRGCVLGVKANAATASKE